MTWKNVLVKEVLRKNVRCIYPNVDREKPFEELVTSACAADIYLIVCILSLKDGVV